MSRIHEALKRAEEEKHGTSSNDLLSQSAEASAAMANPVAPAMPAVAHAAQAAAVAPAPMFEDPAAPLPATQAGFSWDMIVARCPKRTWKPDDRMLFLQPNPTDIPGAEEFRTLRSRLYHFREKKPLKTLLIGSALPGEGKTFVSANLAQTLARQHGRRVVLIDADLRRARLHECMGTDQGPGLSEYLRGDCDEFAALQRGPADNLLFMPGGSAVTHPAELVASPRLEQLISRLSQVFDWIVIDSPPVVPVSDATVLARVCDGVLLVVEAASTPFDMAQRARQEFKHAPLLGVVLNRVAAGASYTSYYYGYGHGYGHTKGTVQ